MPIKYYRLRKNLPTFKAGEIFYLSDAGNLLRESDNIAAYSWTTLDKFPNILTDWFEEVKESTRWKPEVGYKYYLSDSNGSIYDSVWSNDYIDRNRSEIGNCFESREEAEKAVERLKAWERLKDAGLKFKDWNKSNYDRTFCINAEIEHDVVAFDFFKDLRTALDMEIDDEA